MPVTFPLHVRDRSGRDLTIAAAGKCTPDQQMQVETALASFPNFVDMFSKGFSNKEGTEQPVTVHFTEPNTFDDDLKAAGLIPASIERYKSLKAIGFYMCETNQVWLLTAGWKAPEAALNLTGTMRHELGHCIDDLLEQATDNGREVGYFTTRHSTSFTRHWQAGMERAHLNNAEVDTYNRLYNRLIRGIPANLLEVHDDEHDRLQMARLESQMATAFVSPYAATGYQTGALYVPHIYVEFFAEAVETFLDDRLWPNLYRRDLKTYAAIDQVLHFADRGMSLEEVKNHLENSFEGAWCEPAAEPPLLRPRYYTVVAGDTLINIADRHCLFWPDIAEKNCLENPDLIVPGQVLELPHEGIGFTAYGK